MNQQPSSTTIINNGAPLLLRRQFRPQCGNTCDWLDVKCRICRRVRTMAYAYGATFYYVNGTFYQQNGAGYEIVTAPIGANVYTLPNGAYSTTINGSTYYVSGSTYYKPYFDGSQVAYTVAQV